MDNTPSPDTHRVLSPEARRRIFRSTHTDNQTIDGLMLSTKALMEKISLATLRVEESGGKLPYVLSLSPPEMSILLTLLLQYLSEVRVTLEETYSPKPKRTPE